MELSNKAIENIKDLKCDYESKGKLVDKAYLDKLFAIIKDEGMFYWKLQYEYTNKASKVDTMYVEHKRVYICLENLIKKCYELASIWLDQFENTRIIEIQNIYAIYSVLHECTHIYQVFGLYENSELNRLYKNLYDKSERLNLFQMISYSKHPLRYSFERNAILNSFREVARVTDGTEYHDVPEVNYMYAVNDYGVKCPIKYTLIKYRLTDDYDFSDLSLFEKMEHGCFLTPEEEEKIIDITNLYGSEEISYNDGINRLRLLK